MRNSNDSIDESIGTIVKTFETETAHIVRNAFSSRCKYNIHGHSYKYEVSITGPINEHTGMVLDFGQLKFIKEFIDIMDHATIFWSKEDPSIIEFFKLNFKRVLVMEKNPTAENMARLINKYVQDMLYKNFEGDYICNNVQVRETRTGCAYSLGFYDKQDNFTYVYDTDEYTKPYTNIISK